MWHPPINFVTLHYAYVLIIGLLAFVFLYPAGNISAVDAYHFGASVSTVSGLNTVDLRDLRTYQQLYLYIVPTICNMAFINIMVVVVRLFWFRKHLKKVAPALLSAKRRGTPDEDIEEGKPIGTSSETTSSDNRAVLASGFNVNSAGPVSEKTAPEKTQQHSKGDETQEEVEKPLPRTHIKFDPATDQHPRNEETLYIPGPRERDRGEPLLEVARRKSTRDDDDREGRSSSIRPGLRRRLTNGSHFATHLTESKSMDRVATVASSMFVIGSGDKKPRDRLNSVASQQPALNEKPFLSKQVTIGRNSNFNNLTSADREALGGIEYRSLKLLLKIIFTYFFGLHVFGGLCLLVWIKAGPQKYRDILATSALNESWWAFYASQTMVNNLGLTLTPDSMVSFRDAEWPMFIMTFVAFAGNTFYPVFLRLSIWTMSKIMPKSSTMQDPLHFLLDHPRRCYTLLFPSKPTWVLAAILIALNVIDTLLIVVLDLNHPEVATLPVGKRILAALFQAASTRTTGTASFSITKVNPAVQFSLLVMMYISVFPIAISIRASNTYEEKSLGIYEPPVEEVTDAEKSGASYLLKHMQNQLSFDLWYIFLGIFLIAIAEADKIADLNDPAINLFSIFFEMVSAYANVGLSLGHPDVNVSLCGKFTTFSKIVICITMIRGRHRGLPYQLDRAIKLPDEHLIEEASESAESTHTRD